MAALSSGAVDPFRLANGEQVLALQRCGPARRTVLLIRGGVTGGVVAIVAFGVGLALAGGPRLAAFVVSAVVLVTAITLGWFALIRFLEDPHLRAVTTTRAVEVNRSGELRAIPLSRVARVRPLRADGSPADPDDWTAATGLEVESKDGRVFTMSLPSAPDLGPTIVRAVAAQRS